MSNRIQISSVPLDGSYQVFISNPISKQNPDPTTQNHISP